MNNHGFILSKGGGAKVIMLPSSSWYLVPLERANGPSIEKDEMKESELCFLRYEACKFIADIGQKLSFPQRTINTSQLYFHIFYSQHSFKQYPHLVKFAHLINLILGYCSYLDSSWKQSRRDI